MDWLTASARIAFAAMIHDLGKLAERARVEYSAEQIENHKHLYCPYHDDGAAKYHSHVHAAYSAMAISQIETYLPAIVGQDFTPFAAWNSRDADDSLINAAAMHHKPNTFLQWIIATADRLASGFERDFEQYNAEREHNHYRSRLYPLLSELDSSTEEQQSTPVWRYPLQPLSVDALYPQLANDCEPVENEIAQQEYRKLWDFFCSGLQTIPASHRQQWPLWLDHYDSLWMATSHAIPSATVRNTRPDVSLYDHSKATAALATALWRYHAELDHDPLTVQSSLRNRSDYDEEKFILVQGDVFGIQNLIFAQGGDTQKMAAKLLRGRSFYVSLLAETAALRIMEALELPTTSQILNAAGKFLLVAPNTARIRERLESIRQEMNKWFLENTYGEAGLGLAITPACSRDFTTTSKDGSSRYQDLLNRLFRELEKQKFQRFSLCHHEAPSPVFSRYIEQVQTAGGICAVNGRQPCEPMAEQETLLISKIAADQIDLGHWLSQRHLSRLMLLREPQTQHCLRLPMFGFYVAMVSDEEQSGKFGQLAVNGILRRCWDLSLPQSANKPLFQGYARRYINGWVPTFSQHDLTYVERYGSNFGEMKNGDIKSLEHLACENKRLDEQVQSDSRWQGITALGVLKGDIDNLGALFEAGLKKPSFAKTASLSRQFNLFFTTCLPYLCQKTPSLMNTYTVFAGGDDFFLMGPWRSQQDLALAMQKDFACYVGNNPKVHFSVGLLQVKPGYPVRAMAEAAEEALTLAKQHEDQQGDVIKNAISIYGQVVSWSEYEKLLDLSSRLDDLRDEHHFSAGFIYRLLELCDLAAQEHRTPAAALWRSRLAYQIRRNIVDRLVVNGSENAQLKKSQLQTKLACELEGAIRNHGQTYRIALQRHIYLNRA